MKQLYASNKENKEDLKIKFEDFPGDKKNLKRKKICAILIIIAVIFLFVFSSIINEIFLYGNDKNYYKKINDFSGNYAIIKDTKREELLTKIGFDTVLKRNEKMDDKTYETSYAIKKKDKKDLLDSISVYYDENGKVFYVIMNLFYPTEDFSISKVVNDSNNILNNFINLKITKNMISEVKNNNYYYYNDKKTNINTSFQMKLSKENYMFTINVGK